MRHSTPAILFLAALVTTACRAGTGSGVTRGSGVTPDPMQLAYLKASNGDAGDHFGCGGLVQGHAGYGIAVSADGDTLAVGAPHEAGDGNARFDSGAVYVFTQRAGEWTEQAYLHASNPQMSAHFGHAVALSADGNTLAVSAVWESSAATGVNANQKDESIPQAGAVYVFTRQGTSWAQQAYVKASNTGEAGGADTFAEGDQFGFSVALNGDGTVLAVGAISEDGGGNAAGNGQADNSVASAGAIYVFTRAGTMWSQQAYVKPSTIDAGDLFGITVALSEDGATLAAGSFDEDGSSRVVNGQHDNRAAGSGAAYVFVRNGATWSQQAYIKPSNGEPQDAFGVHVALSLDGHTLLVGSLDEDCTATGINAPACDSDWREDLSMGAAYVFVRRGEDWSQQAFLKASNTGFNDWFGARVALSGDGNTAAVAAPFEDAAALPSRPRDGQAGAVQTNNDAREAGAVYLFARTGDTWAQTAYLKGANTEAFDEFGSSVALDRGGATLVVSARGEDSRARGTNGDARDNSAEEAGAAYVFALEH